LESITTQNNPSTKWRWRYLRGIEIIEPIQADEALKTWSDAPGKVFRILVEWE